MADQEDDIDFVSLHNVLYYIYTGTVNLHIRQAEQENEISYPDGYPDEPDPYCLYRNADKFLLLSLKERCYAHLKHGVTPENVAERLFHKECEHHEELQKLYLEYVYANYDKVKVTEGWRSVLCGDFEELPLSAIKYRSRLFYDISQKLVGASK
jgi:hypothetical protein